MGTLNIYLLLSVCFAIGNIILSLIYFIKIKEVWRYIKLFYILANFVVLIPLLQAMFNYRPSSELQLISIIVLLSSQFAGLLVSISKVKVADYLVKEIKKDAAKSNEEINKF